MSNKKRIEELKAEIARLEKEEFRPYLAWVSDENEMPDNKDMPTVIDSYDVKAPYPYRALKGYAGWKYATPLTRKEILSYLPPVKTKYDWDAILKEYPDAQVVARNPDGNIVIGTYTSLKVSPFFDCFYCDKSTGKVLFAGRKPEWILKDCDWRDSIEYRRNVV